MKQRTFKTLSDAFAFVQKLEQENNDKKLSIIIEKNYYNGEQYAAVQWQEK